MTLYSQLKKAIEHGLMPVVTGDDGGYTVWTSIREDGSIRCSHRRNSIEECLESLGIISPTEKWINIFESHFNGHIIGYHQPKITPYKVGELVDVLESARECRGYEEWSKEKKAMVGDKGLKINDVMDTTEGLNYYVWNKEQTSAWTFSHAHVAPHFPESEPETIEMTLEEVATKLKIDVKKLRIKE